MIKLVRNLESPLLVPNNWKKLRQSSKFSELMSVISRLVIPESKFSPGMQDRDTGAGTVERRPPATADVLRADLRAWYFKYSLV